MQSLLPIHINLWSITYLLVEGIQIYINYIDGSIILGIRIEIQKCDFNSMGFVDS